MITDRISFTGAPPKFPPQCLFGKEGLPKPTFKSTSPESRSKWFSCFRTQKAISDSNYTEVRQDNTNAPQESQESATPEQALVTDPSKCDEESFGLGELFKESDELVTDDGDCLKNLLNNVLKLKINAFENSALKIFNTIADIEEKLNACHHDPKTGLPFTKEKIQEITNLVNKLDLLFFSFCSGFLLLKRNSQEIEILNKTIRRVCALNETVFERTAFLNTKTNYVLVNMNYTISKLELTDDVLPELQIKIQMQYVRDLNYRFERNEVDPKYFKSIIKNINKLILKFSQFPEDSKDKGIHFLFKHILEINNFIFEQNIAIDVSPLMDPSVIEKFDLKEKVFEIVQADVTQFYFKEMTLLVAEKKKKGKKADADDFVDVSEKYVLNIVEKLINSNATQNFIEMIISRLIWISIYGSTFLYIYDQKERNKVINNIFKKTNLIIPKTSLIEPGQAPYVILRITSTFLVYLQPLIHKSLSEHNIQINPFADFSAEQLKYLTNFIYSTNSFVVKISQTVPDSTNYTKNDINTHIIHNKGNNKYDLYKIESCSDQPFKIEKIKLLNPKKFNEEVNEQIDRVRNNWLHLESNQFWEISFRLWLQQQESEEEDLSFPPG